MRQPKLRCFANTTDGVTTYTNESGWTDEKIIQQFGGIHIALNPDDGKLWYWNEPPDYVNPGAPVERRYGPTGKRPTAAMTAEDKGFLYWDNTIDKPVFWAGSRWKFADGTNA